MKKELVEKQLTREKGLVLTDDLKFKNPVFRKGLENLEKGLFQKKIRKYLGIPESISDRDLAFVIMKKMLGYFGNNFKGQKGGVYTLQSICEELFQDVLSYINSCSIINGNLSVYAFRIHRELLGKIERRNVSVPKAYQSHDQKLSTYDKFKKGSSILSVFIEYTDLVQIVYGKTVTNKSCKTLKWNDSVVNTLQDNSLEDTDITYLPLKIPMVSKPFDWKDRFNGGYYCNSSLEDLRIRNSLISYKNKLIPLPADTEISADILEGVNTLQNTPWKINNAMLNVAEKFYLEDNLEKNIDIQALHIARDCSSYDKIWFPYFMDFRGRLYSSPIYLNYQSTDMAKSLLLFSQSKQLGKNGKKWLAIHGANCFGEDKVSLKERLEWVEGNHSEIIKSAKNPYENEFWTEADKPWQFLAFCFEWAEMSKMENPEKYKCSLPISIDGTCNVYQHLSALLKDKESGTKVNLRALPERYDIYQILLGRLKEQFKKIIESSEEGNEKEFSEFWLSILDRKLIKIIMVAIPYGLTKDGARREIDSKILKYKGFSLGKDKKDFEACRFLAEEVFRVISIELPSVTLVKEWVKSCVKVFNKEKLPLQWTTPSGFKLYQAYCKTKNKRADLSWGKTGRIQTNVVTETNEINLSDQTNKIFPNVEHALDASHLMKTILKAKREEGIKSLASVHDSFSCLPADMEKLSRITRETFVEIYSKNILQDMKKQFLKQLPKGTKLPRVPSRGELDINEVLKSEYAFS